MNFGLATRTHTLVEFFESFDDGVLNLASLSCSTLIISSYCVLSSLTQYTNLYSSIFICCLTAETFCFVFSGCDYCEVYFVMFDHKDVCVCGEINFSPSHFATNQRFFLCCWSAVWRFDAEKFISFNGILSILCVKFVFVQWYELVNWPTQFIPKSDSSLSSPRC